MPLVNALFRQLTEGQTSPLPLAIFRISFSAVLLAEVAQLFYFRRLFFDDLPYIRPGHIPPEPLLLFWAAAVFCVLIGYHTRTAALINYIFCVAILGYGAMQHGYDWHVDSTFITVGLLLMMMPSDRVLSLRHWLEARRGPVQTAAVSRVYTVLLVLGVGSIYLDSMLWKLTSPMYLSGLSFWAPSSLPYNTYMDIAPLLASELLNRLAGYAVLFLEVTFIVLIWLRRTRPFILALGIIFHLGIMIAFPIPIFSLMMFALYCGFIPADYYHRLWNRLVPGRYRWSPPALHTPDRPTTQPAERTAAGFIVVWVLSLLLIGLASPFARTYITGQTALSGQMERLGWAYRGLVYPWTGFSTHGVFMDQHFATYTCQMMLIYRDANGETVLPFITQDGLAGPYNTNRSYVVWTFRTVRPTLSRQQQEQSLLRYVAFWAGATGADLHTGAVYIRQRPIRVSLSEWQPDLLVNNREVPWQEVGQISMAGDTLSVGWDEDKADVCNNPRA